MRREVGEHARIHQVGENVFIGYIAVDLSSQLDSGRVEVDLGQSLPQATVNRLTPLQHLSLQIRGEAALRIADLPFEEPHHRLRKLDFGRALE